MRTKTIEDLSKSDRGLSAERIPIGVAMSIQRMAPPRTRPAVGGIASATISFTERRLAYESPERLVDHQPLEEEPVLHVDRPVELEIVLDPLDVLSGRRLAGRLARRVDRHEEEEDVRDQRHADEQEHGPEQATDEELEHWRVWVSSREAGRGAEAPLPVGAVLLDADRVQERS